MSTKLFLSISLILAIALTGYADDALMGWWKLDGDAKDSSGNDRHGSLHGSPTFGPGVFGQALELGGNPDYITIDGYKGILGTHAFSIAAWINTTNTAQGQIMHWGTHAGGQRLEFRIQSNRLRVTHGLGNVQGDTTVTDGEWYHVAVTVIENARAFSDDVTLYVNGTEDTRDKADPDGWDIVANPTLDLTIGWRPTEQDRPFIGSMDDVVLYDRVLTQEDVTRIMNGDILPPSGQAGGEDPADEMTDVLRDATLTWSPGTFPATHNIYFGTSFEDVNSATVGTIAGLDVNSFDPGPLEFGQTYFWRVDEVNTTPDKTVFKGEVWSFEVEPHSIPIAGSDIIATASSSSNEFSTPDKTLDGSGLDANDMHGTNPETMWFSANVDLDPWIQYELVDVLKLDVMKVWNSNGSSEMAIGWSVKDVEIAYSVDGETWDVLADANQFSRGPGSPTYNAYDEIDFGGAAAKYVRLNIQSNWGGILMSYSLSEVQFSMIPVRVRTPEPASGTVDVLSDATVSWRPGREAAEHRIYIGTDANEVAEGLASSVTTAANRLDLGSLDLALGQTYYWRVDEVNEAEAASVWAGPVWSFAMVPNRTVDDFDRYNNFSPDRPFQTWLDGFGYSADEFFPVAYGGNGTGAGIGHDIWSISSPHYDGQIMEDTIARDGRSMPLYYSNTGGLTVAETQRTLDPAQNWGGNGIQSLSVNIYGAPENSGQLYLKINNTRIDYAGLSDALQKQQWIPWNIDLAGIPGLDNVTSLAIGIEGSGATGLIYIDNIGLYPEVPQLIDPVVPGDGDPNLVSYYAFEGNADDSIGDHHATPEGAPLYVQGKSGQAISFDGFVDYVVHAFDADEIWPAASVSLWARTDALAQDLNSSVFNNNSAANDFQIEMNGGDPGFYRYNGTVDDLFGATTSEWVHLATSCDGITTDLYYNGLFVTTVETADTQFGQIAMGINRGMVNMFEGEVDEVRVYNRALSAAEVAGLAGMTEAVPASF